MTEHGMTLESIVHGYVAIGVCAGFVIASVYAWFATRAALDLRDGRR